MLKFYTLFHLNLMYSSIDKNRRLDVIKNCYWKIFDLVDLGIPIGIESSGITLEIVKKIDPKWIKTLKENIKNKKIEFIGSGYSQIIGPLVPAEINNMNQLIGKKIYRRLLNYNPKISLINEMSYSSGLLDHYKDNGYDAIIMEWNNSFSNNSHWDNDLRYYPQFATHINSDSSIPLIWADSTAFQKFQAFIYSKINKNEYVDYLKSHVDNKDRFFPIYSSDVEVFDFRPGRFQFEPKISEYSEWVKICNLYKDLARNDWCEFIFPSKVLEGLKAKKAGNKLILDSIENPIVVKKQNKYNVYRWALTGRNDLNINSRCFRILKIMLDSKKLSTNNWKEICYLWSSDFRTHITKNRWLEIKKRLKLFEKQIGNKKVVANKISKQFTNLYIKKTSTDIEFKNKNYKILLDKINGLTIKKLFVGQDSKKFALGMLSQGFYQNITLGVDFFSGHSIISRFAKNQIVDLEYVEPEILDHGSEVLILSKYSSLDFKFSKIIKLRNKEIILRKKITIQKKEKLVIHPFIFTLNPEFWDIKSIYVSTNCGGNQETKYFLNEVSMIQDNLHSLQISARNGFGNTDGSFTIGDDFKKIFFKNDMSTCAMIPSIVFKCLNNQVFFRLKYSAGEIDETLVKKKRVINAKLKIIF